MTDILAEQDEVEREINAVLKESGLSVTEDTLSLSMEEGLRRMITMLRAIRKINLQDVAMYLLTRWCKAMKYSLISDESVWRIQAQALQSAYNGLAAAAVLEEESNDTRRTPDTQSAVTDSGVEDLPTVRGAVPGSDLPDEEMH